MTEAAKGTITTETAGPDIKAPPAQSSESGIADEEHIELPNVEEAKPELIAALAKVALARILDDPSLLEAENDEQLASIHFRLHQLWETANAGKLEITRPEFLKVHSIVVAEMTKRGMEHNIHDELDNATRRKQTRKFGGDGYNESYYAGLSDVNTLFVSDLAEVLKAFPDQFGKALEVGCGTGRALDVLRSSGHIADGAEISDYAASACRKRGHEVALADATELPFQDGLYDVVFSMDVMEHVQDFQKALTESARVARLRTVHLVPLGIRRDASHKHVFKTLEDLRKVVMECKLPVTSVSRTPTNKAIVIVDKEATVGESLIGPYLHDFCIVPDFVSLAGGAVKTSDPKDIDIVWRANEPIGGMMIALRNLLPEEMREKVHHILNPQGPHDDHVPLYDLVARLRTPRHVTQIVKAALKPNQKFTPLKTSSGYTQQEYFAPEEFYDQWAKPFIEEGTRLDVEQKWNGYRTVAEFDGKDTLIYFEDSTDDRSAQLKVIGDELRAIGKPVILDMDLHAIYGDGRIAPRVELSGLISKGTEVDDKGKFTTPSGAVAHLAPRVFDILYLGEEDLHGEPWDKRREVLNKVFKEHDFKLFKISPAKVVSSKADLLDEVKRVSKEPGSEGAVVKVVTSDYPLNGKTTAWAKVKNVLEVKVEVIDRKPIKGSRNTWNYIVGYTDEGGKLRELGKTFNSMVDAKPGDILTLAVGEVIPKYNEQDKTWEVSAVVPRVEDLETGSVKAETVASIIRRAHEANVLQVSPEVEAELRRTVLKGAAKPKPGKEEVVKAEGSVSFKEGDSGTGVLQTHERGLSEDQTKLVHDFGWDPVVFTDAEIGELSDVAGKDVGAAYKAAQNGNSGSLGKLLDKVDLKKLSKPQRILVARAMPMSVHTDFRMRPGKETFWEGGEGFTPGNQFQQNKFRLIAEGTDPALKILMNFKVGRGDAVTSSLSKAQEPVRGPLGWLTIGQGEPEVFPPGAVGSTADAYSRFLVRDEFKWRAGVQDPHYKEFEFDGKVLNGRWIFQFVPVGEGSADQGAGRAWMISRPSKQDFDSKQLQKGIAYVMPILKQDTVKRIVTGIVLKPNVTDAQGDVIAPQDIEEAAHKYLLRYRKGSVVGYMHKDMERKLYVVESWIAPAAFELNGHSIPEGAWVMSVYVADDDAWVEVQAGKLRGFSIGGMAKARPVE